MHPSRAHSFPQVRQNCPEALQCVGALAKALVKSWEPYVQQLLEHMMLTGLSEVLVTALKDVAEALPTNRELLRCGICVVERTTQRERVYVCVCVCVSFHVPTPCPNTRLAPPLLPGT
jgi:hypothetical protein